MPPRRPALAMLILSCAATSPAAAGEVVFTSTAPYWQVGVRDNDLSRACSMDEFGPLRLGALVARFTGSEGPALLDIAKGTGQNLRDPKHLTKRNEDYFFRNAATTSCEVLVGGRGSGGKITPALR